jgi:transglutaminase-like putative cysteine protease
MQRYRIVHTTEYRFEKAAWNFELIGRLQPLDEAGQKCDYFQIVSRPPASLENLPVDMFGNRVHCLRIMSPLQRLQVSAVSTVTRVDRREGLPEQAQRARIDDLQTASSHPSPYLEATRLTPVSDKIRAYAAHISNRRESIHTQAETLNRRIHADLKFAVGSTHDQTSAEAVLASRRGVCQDFAHLAIACARSLGLAARYVGGYVHTAAFRGKGHRIAADASHAWFEVFDPLTGWLGFDPANNLRADDNYIVAARGRDYNDACPLQGCFEGGGTHRLQVSVDVQRIGRNKIPYS